MTSNTYDAAGNQLTELQETDANGDGVINHRAGKTYNYGANGNILTRLLSADRDGDGEFETADLTDYGYTPIRNGLEYLIDYYDRIWPDIIAAP